MKEKFFNNKKTLACFIAYVLITAFIFSQSLLPSDASGKQSGFFGEVVSSVVGFFTGNNVDLEADGKNKEYYPESISLGVLPKTLTVGKTYTLDYSFNPAGNYPLSKVTYTSSNEDVLTVSPNGVITPVSQGVAEITVKDGFSGVYETVRLTVGNTVYVPDFTYLGIVDRDAAPTTESIYYSPTNDTSAVYALVFRSEVPIDKLSVECVKGNASLILCQTSIRFAPKTVGEIVIRTTVTYDNVEGKNRTYITDHTINVKEKLLPSFPCELNLNVSDTVTMVKGETFSFTSNAIEHYGDVELIQKGIFATYDNRVIDVGGTGDTFSVNAIKEGSTTLSIYYLYGSDIKKKSVTINVQKPVPTATDIIAPSKYLRNGEFAKLTVMGDGEAYKPSEFDWTVEGITDHTFNGTEHIFNENGTVTVTATHKEIQGFTVTKQFEVRYPYGFYVRKIFGHFLLFTFLSLFACVVYNRLGKVISPKHATILAVVFTIVAGLLTAGASELLQLDAFTSGRGASLVDFAIDFLGYLLGTLIVWITSRLVKNRKKKKLYR